MSPALLLIGGAAGMAESGRDGSAWPFVGGIVLAYLAAVGAALSLRAGISPPGYPAPRAWPFFVLLMPLALPVTVLALSAVPPLGALLAAATVFAVYRMIRSLGGDGASPAKS